MKRILFSVFIAMVMLFAVSGVALATDPIVSVDIVSPGGGDVTVTTTGKDASTWHPGQVGEVNTFRAEGGFTASYDAYTGNYGALNTFVNASSTTGARFTMIDTHSFHILSANYAVGTVGTFKALAESLTNVAMNLKSIGSMYVWSEASNGGVGLSGTHIAKQYDMNTGGPLTATMTIEAYATNGASISNSAAWGFGGWESGTISTNYNGGTRSLTASGIGSYMQYVNAGINATSNASMSIDGTPVVVNASLPAGGAATIIANFLNGFTANPYIVTAK